jgi:hypothetical protein
MARTTHLPKSKGNVTVTPLPPPPTTTPPTTTGSLTLAWDASPTSNIMGYKIKYGMQPGDHPVVEDVGSVLQYTVSPLDVGVTYYFIVTAYQNGQDGTKVESIASNEVSGTPQAAGTMTKTTGEEIRARTLILVPESFEKGNYIPAKSIELDPEDTRAMYIFLTEVYGELVAEQPIKFATVAKEGGD